MGREEIRKAHEFSHAAKFGNSRLAVLDHSVRFPVAQVAIARARWSLEGHVAPDGDALPPRTGTLLDVLSDASGRWLIIGSQNTDAVEGGSRGRSP